MTCTEMRVSRGEWVWFEKTRTIFLFPRVLSGELSEEGVKVEKEYSPLE